MSVCLSDLADLPRDVEAGQVAHGEGPDREAVLVQHAAPHTTTPPGSDTGHVWTTLLCTHTPDAYQHPVVTDLLLHVCAAIRAIVSFIPHPLSFTSSNGRQALPTHRSTS